LARTFRGPGKNKKAIGSGPAFWLGRQRRGGGKKMPGYAASSPGKGPVLAQRASDTKGKVVRPGSRRAGERGGP